jgi:hypothetical protein
VICYASVASTFPSVSTRRHVSSLAFECNRLDRYHRRSIVAAALIGISDA